MLRKCLFSIFIGFFLSATPSSYAVDPFDDHHEGRNPRRAEQRPQAQPQAQCAPLIPEGLDCAIGALVLIAVPTAMYVFAWCKDIFCPEAKKKN